MHCKVLLVCTVQTSVEKRIKEFLNSEVSKMTVPRPLAGMPDHTAPVFAEEPELPPPPSWNATRPQGRSEADEENLPTGLRAAADAAGIPLPMTERQELQQDE